MMAIWVIEGWKASQITSYSGAAEEKKPTICDQKLTNLQDFSISAIGRKRVSYIIICIDSCVQPKDC